MSSLLQCIRSNEGQGRGGAPQSGICGLGDIVSYDPETGYYHVTYEDGDKEDLSRAAVQAGVRRFQQAQAK
ncbi:hypothetical protein EMIHUDRAFT_210002 [Emiliania huxleyi CCMP1516]|uniref:PTM/DIR17-like Tudor domain-containing protein n=2 Tax=Emiliania huxleyi TaxID=2903 RepID=A0A0D3J1G8_EMIH1|nr:hypothetical protein EMIHUDRAFT_210002 [Emiliania huxleyi CCMP1516]EOD17353.1 hypothetical protein EMIHUDRAFT_210002 [Emiliania huxleyi CCMP1516]|eukprot:XP_005769782.1 hypothetical protein EMIHUDRAFT_210002 [Emiliania huxleyi CCMP1516]